MVTSSASEQYGKRSLPASSCRESYMTRRGVEFRRLWELGESERDRERKSRREEGMNDVAQD